MKPTVVMERQDYGKGPRVPDTEAADEQVRPTVGTTSSLDFLLGHGGPSGFPLNCDICEKMKNARQKPENPRIER